MTILLSIPWTSAYPKRTNPARGGAGEKEGGPLPSPKNRSDFAVEVFLGHLQLFLQDGFPQMALDLPRPFRHLRPLDCPVGHKFSVVVVRVLVKLPPASGPLYTEQEFNTGPTKD